jgi:hypothetical protein
MIHNGLPDFNSLETANRVSLDECTHLVVAPEEGPKTLLLATGLSGIRRSDTANLVATITGQVVAHLRADSLDTTKSSIPVLGLSASIEESSVFQHKNNDCWGNKWPHSSKSTRNGTPELDQPSSNI